MKTGSKRRAVTVLVSLLVAFVGLLGAGTAAAAAPPPPSVYVSPLNPALIEELQNLGIELNPGDPVVEDVTPNGGLTTGGTEVVITGTDFSGATKVTFGDAESTDFTVDSDTQITAIAPEHAAGTIQVQVTTPEGESPDTSADDFTYVNPPPTTAAPTTAPPATAAPTTVLPTETTLTSAATVTAVPVAEDEGGGLSGAWIALIVVIAVIALGALSTMVYMLGRRGGKGGPAA